MTQQEIDQAVAQATGEALDTIQAHGFGLLGNPKQELHQEDEPQGPSVLDWDALEARCLTELLAESPQE